MSLPVRFSPEAAEDVGIVYDGYEQVRPGLGSQFMESVDAAAALIARFPESGRVVRDEIRRILAHRFPYGLSYVIGDGEIVVLGCFHLRRDPRVWLSRGRGLHDA